jgi:hypothetical protein
MVRLWCLPHPMAAAQQPHWCVVARPTMGKAQTPPCLA